MIMQRYIAKTVISTTLLVLLIVLGLQLFIGLVGESGDLGSGNYGIFQAIIYVLLTLPQNLYLLFPLTGLIGSLLSLGILANNSELIVMRAAGMSVWKIIAAVMLAAIAMIVVVTAIGELLAPPAEHYAQTRKTIETSGGQALRTPHGIWLREGNSFLHIAQVLPGDRLSGISRYQFNNQHQLTKASYAKNAYYYQTDWVVNDVSSSILSNKKVTNQYKKQARWKLSLGPELLHITRISPREMSLVGLYHYIQYRYQNGLRPNNYNLMFWQRVYRPLFILVMIFLAIPFIFGPLRSATMGLRTLTGVIIGFSFYTLNQLLGSFSIIYQFNLSIVMLLPVFIFGLLAIGLMRRVR